MEFKTNERLYILSYPPPPPHSSKRTLKQGFYIDMNTNEHKYMICY